MDIGLYHLISDVHNEGYIDDTLDSFLAEIEKGLGKKLIKLNIGQKYEDVFPIIFIKSGGVEGKLKEIYERFDEPYIILASGIHNSLAASIEILSFLRQKGKKAEIIHGSSDYVVRRISELETVFETKKRLQSARVGVVGKPSDWLIASNMDYDIAKKVLGIKIMDIDLKELVSEIDKEHDYRSIREKELYDTGYDKGSIDGALKIYRGLRYIVDKYKLNAVTVRCFDLLKIYNSSGCIAASLLNDEGIIAGCEGDVPSVISMLITNYLTGRPVFMANPSRINITSNMVTFAHCTLPLSMAENYRLDTHFESGIGVGIKGNIKTGRCTVFKLSGDCKSFFVSGADLVENLNDKNLCRTQINVKLDEDVSYFFNNPLGNHHIICTGDYSNLIREFFK